MIPVFSNTLGDEELQAVQSVFQSRWLGKGHHCQQLEQELSDALKAQHVLLTNNCTAGIYIAMRALGIGSGDEVIVSTINYVACAGAARDLGATLRFADVHPRTLAILPSEIERLKTPRTKAVVMLHYGGHAAPMDEIMAACGDRVALIEDSANALTATYKGKSCGTFGDAGVFSFDAMKIMVMGDGGLLVMRDPAMFEKAKVLRYLGLAGDSQSGTDALKHRPQRWWQYELEDTSGRFISNDILAAIGREQLKKLPTFISTRTTLWEAYQQQLEDVPGLQRPPQPAADTTSAYYLYWVQLPQRRDELAAHLLEHDIYTTYRYHPLHHVRLFNSTEPLANADLISSTTLNLPLHQNLSESDVTRICDLIRRFLH